MLDPKYLGLTISQSQGNAGLTNMLDSKYLGLEVSQAQGYVSLTNMPDQNTWTFKVLRLYAWSWMILYNKSIKDMINIILVLISVYKVS